MQFFNRIDELKEMRELEKQRSMMLVLYGKRRMSKTALIKNFSKTQNRKIFTSLFQEMKKSII